MFLISLNRERGKYIDIKDRKLARKVELRGIKRTPEEGNQKKTEREEGTNWGGVTSIKENKNFQALIMVK